MLSPHHVAWTQMEAERAFRRAKRDRRRSRLDVHDQRAMLRKAPAGRDVRDIPLAAIVGTLDPGRALQFDRAFRPAERTRRRWLRVWMAGELPPISVIALGDEFAVLDGHHRVSVAIARGESTIAAVVV